ncbi:hypothetical protein AOLI_G00149330 [Acnodon oligacanthus]
MQKAAPPSLDRPTTRPSLRRANQPLVGGAALCRWLELWRPDLVVQYETRSSGCREAAASGRLSLRAFSHSVESFHNVVPGLADILPH